MDRTGGRRPVRSIRRAREEAAGAPVRPVRVHPGALPTIPSPPGRAAVEVGALLHSQHIPTEVCQLFWTQLLDPDQLKLLPRGVGPPEANTHNADAARVVLVLEDGLH